MRKSTNHLKFKEIQDRKTERNEKICFGKIKYCWIIFITLYMCIQEFFTLITRKHFKHFARINQLAFFARRLLDEQWEGMQTLEARTVLG